MAEYGTTRKKYHVSANVFRILEILGYVSTESRGIFINKKGIIMNFFKKSQLCQNIYIYNLLECFLKIKIIVMLIDQLYR